MPWVDGVWMPEGDGYSQDEFNASNWGTNPDGSLKWLGPVDQRGYSPGVTTTQNGVTQGWGIGDSNRGGTGGGSGNGSGNGGYSAEAAALEKQQIDDWYNQQKINRDYAERVYGEDVSRNRERLSRNEQDSWKDSIWKGGNPWSGRYRQNVNMVRQSWGDKWSDFDHTDKRQRGQFAQDRLGDYNTYTQKQTSWKISDAQRRASLASDLRGLG